MGVYSVGRAMVSKTICHRFDSGCTCCGLLQVTPLLIYFWLLCYAGVLRKIILLINESV